MKIKVVHLIQSLDNGGCENMLLRTLPLLKKIDQEIMVLKNEGELAPKFKKEGIKVIRIKNYFDLIIKLKQFKPNLIITYLFHADLVGRMVLQTLGFKVIPYLRTTYNFSRYRLVRVFEKITKYLVKKYLANSEAVKKYYIENIGVNSRSIEVIPNGVDLKIYETAKKSRNLIRNKFKASDNEVVIVCVANFHPNKGHKYLLEAFEEVYRDSQNIWLWLVGDGEEKESLHNQIEKYESKNKIVFMGVCQEVPKILSGSDIFVLPTLFEGMSNALMEAMAIGLPVVTTDIPENRILVDKKSGILVKPENSSEIKGAIKMLMNSRARKELGVEGKRVIEQEYNIGIISQKFEKFILNES